MNATYTIQAGYQPAAARATELRNAVAAAKFVATMIAAPLLGLAAVIVAPLAGLFMLARMLVRAMPKRVRDVALFLAAPVVGLVYALAFPLIGVGLLAWAGIKAARGQ